MQIADSPLELFAKISGKHDYCYLLESENSSSRLAEYSFVAFDPTTIFKVAAKQLEVKHLGTGRVLKKRVDEPLAELKKLLAARSGQDSKFRLLGGAVGYVSYDAVRFWEKLPKALGEASGFPEMEFGIFDDGVVFNHKSGAVSYYYYERDRSETVLRLASDPFYVGQFTSGEPDVSPSRSRFEMMVRDTKDHVIAGDIFQAVISKQYRFKKTTGDFLRFYQNLRVINPSPYMYYLKLGRRQIIGSSPEMLFRVEGSVVESFPIAGTRPFTSDSERNESLKREMLSDPKEKAEHLMLVDLARNDVGKVSRFGSVKTTEFMTVQRFSHVQHIVSHVVGELRQGLDCFDAFKAIFPAGTVSGAPKPRAMEIIADLEDRRRGPYAGAVGYFAFNGNADFAIAIRTLFANGNECYLQTGAGIVADSDPEREWLETEAKAGAMLQALQEASGRKR